MNPNQFPGGINVVVPPQELNARSISNLIPLVGRKNVVPSPSQEIVNAVFRAHRFRIIALAYMTVVDTNGKLSVFP